MWRKVGIYFYNSFNRTLWVNPTKRGNYYRILLANKLVQFIAKKDCLYQIWRKSVKFATDFKAQIQYFRIFLKKENPKMCSGDQDRCLFYSHGSRSYHMVIWIAQYSLVKLRVYEYNFFLKFVVPTLKWTLYTSLKFLWEGVLLKVYTSTHNHNTIRFR